MVPVLVSPISQDNFTTALVSVWMFSCDFWFFNSARDRERERVPCGDAPVVVGTVVKF